MKKNTNSWAAILGDEMEKASGKVFDYLVNTGEPWEEKPGFCTENESLPYELVLTADRPLAVSGLMKFNASTAEWECLLIEPMATDAPKSAWQVLALEEWSGESELIGTPPSRLSLINERGKEVYVDCPVYALMRESVAEGKRFRIGLYMVACSIQREEKTMEITEGKILEMERARRKEQDSDFKPEELTSITIDLSGKRAFLQGREERVTDFLTMVESVTPIELHGRYGYKLTCDLAAHEDIALPVDIYIFENSLNGYIPKEKDYISGNGILYGIPLEEVSGKNSPRFPEDAPGPELSSKDKEWLEFLSSRPELPLATKVVIGSFIRTDWKIMQASTKFFSKMVPAFIAKKPQGSTYAVFIDCRREGKYEYPDLNQEELDDINKRCQQYGYKTIRFRVEITEEAKTCNYGITPIGKFPHKMSFNVSVKKPSRKIASEEVVRSAVAAFAETINKVDMTHVSAWLDEDLHYLSQTVGTEINGKITFLRYFTVALAQWEQNKSLPKAVTGTISWKNRRHPCTAVIYDGKVTACTVMRARGGFVTEMVTLPESTYGKFKADEE